MAKTARARGATRLLPSLPEEIVIWDILVRLPPKSLIRCRPVCRAWWRVTSTRDFLRAHHDRQPSLPVVCGYETAGYGHNQSIHALDHRAAGAQLQPLARLDRLDEGFSLEASCDGLFILLIQNSGPGRWHYLVHNPATQQYARLEGIDGFEVLGIYHHGPTGKYRLLMCWFRPFMGYENPACNGRDGFYVFALGFCQPPRHIGCLEAREVRFHAGPCVFRGNLHWHLWRKGSGRNIIMVFDTTAESFMQMRAPVVPAYAHLFEMDGALGMSFFNDVAKTVDIWLMQDYGHWACKCRVELPVAEIKARFETFDRWDVVAASCDGDVLVLVKFRYSLILVDINGKLVAGFHYRCLGPAQLQLKPTLVPHTFFPA